MGPSWGRSGGVWGARGVPEGNVGSKNGFCGGPTHTLFATLSWGWDLSEKESWKKTSMRSDRYLQWFGYFWKENTDSLDLSWGPSWVHVWDLFLMKKRIVFFTDCWMAFGAMLALFWEPFGSIFHWLFRSKNETILGSQKSFPDSLETVPEPSPGLDAGVRWPQLRMFDHWSIPTMKEESPAGSAKKNNHAMPCAEARWRIIIIWSS